MSLNRVFLSLLLIEVFTKCVVEGLQCYVCEQCNKYKDFKELQICGEISIATTMKPIVITETTDRNNENVSTMSPVVKTSTKPSLRPSIDDYLYEDSEETYSHVSAHNSKQKNTTQAATTTLSTTASKTETTTKSTVQEIKSVTENPATLIKEPTTTTELKTTIQILATTTQQESITKFKTDNKTDISTLSTEKVQPILASDYDDDYLEYEDARSIKSLIKINKPVCYMIKYQVNNTVFTNRGCTTFINDNKYLTCQSLNNGTPMESCRVCSTNGCNKLFGDEDGDGIFFNSADVRKHFDAVVLFFWILLNLSII